MRYVLKNGEEFVKWIQWTAGVIPTVRNDQFEKAMIMDEEYLDYPIEKTGKNRRELIKEYHPQMELVKVQVTIAE